MRQWPRRLPRQRWRLAAAETSWYLPLKTPRTTSGSLRLRRSRVSKSRPPPSAGSGQAQGRLRGTHIWSWLGTELGVNCTFRRGYGLLARWGWLLFWKLLCPRRCPKCGIQLGCSRSFEDWPLSPMRMTSKPGISLVYATEPPPTAAQEVRCSVRFPLSLPVVVQTPRRELTALTRNVSASGVLFETHNSLPVGERISFSLRMPGAVLGTPHDVLVNCRGRVVRCSKSQAQSQVAATIDEYQFVEQ